MTAVKERQNSILSNKRNEEENIAEENRKRTRAR